MYAPTKKMITSDLGSLMGILGTLGGTVAGGFLVFRNYLSKTSLNIEANSADIGTIKRLNALLDEERTERYKAQDRADEYSKQLNASMQQMGELRAKVELLTSRVEQLTEELKKHGTAKVQNTTGL